MDLEQQKHMNEVMQEIPNLQPSDIELMEMFEHFIKNQPKVEGEEEIPNLPRGFGQ